MKQVRLNPTIQSNVVSYTVIVSADNPEGKLKPGMTAFVQITANRREGVLRVPNAALRFRPPADPAQADKSGRRSKGAGSGNRPLAAGAIPARRDGSSRVYRLVDGKLTPVPIRTGIADANYTEVAGGRDRGRRQARHARPCRQGGPQSQLRLRMF